MADLAADPPAVAGVPALPERSRCGIFSLVLAGCACAAAIAALSVFVQTPKTAPVLVQNIVLYGFIAVFLVAAPLAHVRRAQRL